MNADPNMLDELLKGCKTPEDVDALPAQLLQRMINRALDAGTDSHLGYDRSERAESQRRTNARNGKSSKTVQGTFGALEITTPRDRDGSFVWA
jgi:putative transposase